MIHTVFAVFDDEAAAAAAVADLESRGTPRSHCEVVVHRGTLACEGLHAGESASRRGAVTMAAAGTALGALAAGLIAGPIAGAAFAALVGGTKPHRGSPARVRSSACGIGSACVSVRAS